MGGALLLGRDEVVLGVVPHHRTDAILRVHDLDRYDDRDDIRTNLLESYDRLMAFVNKHIADPFYLEGNRRISLRDRIFREMQWAEELGSGVRNLSKYARAFGGQDPILNEESIFRVTVMLPTLPISATGSQTGVKPQPESGAESGAESQARRVLVALSAGALGKAELASRLALPSVSGALNRSIRSLLDAGLIEYTLPDKPNSRLQKYRLTAAGRVQLNSRD